jgi:hypothetical protein
MAADARRSRANRHRCCAASRTVRGASPPRSYPCRAEREISRAAHIWSCVKSSSWRQALTVSGSMAIFLYKGVRLFTSGLVGPVSRPHRWAYSLSPSSSGLELILTASWKLKLRSKVTKRLSHSQIFKYLTPFPVHEQHRAVHEPFLAFLVGLVKIKSS